MGNYGNSAAGTLAWVPRSRPAHHEMLGIFYLMAILLIPLGPVAHFVYEQGIRMIQQTAGSHCLHLIIEISFHGPSIARW